MISVPISNRYGECFGILDAMRRASLLLATALLLLALVPSGAAVDATASGKAKLRLLDPTPVKVRGTGFSAGERVVVRVIGLAGVTGKRTTAGRRGGWTLTFPDHAYGRCGSLFVSAVGSRGSRAGLKLKPPLCPLP